MRPRGRSHVVVRCGGVEVRWRSAFPGMALLPALAVGFAPLPTVIAIVGSVALVLIHELGHALAARAIGLRVVGLTVGPDGGECRVVGEPCGRGAEMLFDAGGLLAQGLVLLLGLALGRHTGASATEVQRGLWLVMLPMNALMMLMNLLPGRITRRGGLTDGERLRRSLVRAWRATRPRRLRARSARRVADAPSRRGRAHDLSPGERPRVA